MVSQMADLVYIIQSDLVKALDIFPVPKAIFLLPHLSHLPGQALGYTI
jgi:hypothetical protein